jgi:hypothetical protein
MYLLSAICTNMCTVHRYVVMICKVIIPRYGLAEYTSLIEATRGVEP